MRRGARSLRDRMLANKRALDHLADMAGKPRMDIAIPPPPRARKPSGKPLERDVIRAVRQLLAVHPSVLFAVRQNSGGLRDSRDVPIKFYEIVRRGPIEVTLPDFWGFLKLHRAETPSFIPFAIECKAPGWKHVTDAREARQRDYLGFIREIGGRAGFATNAEQALAIIEGRDTK